MTAGVRKKQALTAAFESALHPRGKDGKFIEKLGLISLSGLGKDRDGKRAKVIDIIPNRNEHYPSDIKVQLLDDDDKPNGETFTVKPENVSQAPEKARLGKQPSAATDDDLSRFKPEDRGLVQQLRDRVRNWKAVEDARRWADAEVTVNVNPGTQTDEERLQQTLEELRARVHGRSMARAA